MRKFIKAPKETFDLESNTNTLKGIEEPCLADFLNPVL